MASRAPSLNIFFYNYNNNNNNNNNNTISKGISIWLLDYRIKSCQTKTNKHKETKDHQRYNPNIVPLESIKLTTGTSLSSTKTWTSARKQSQAL